MIRPQSRAISDAPAPPAARLPAVFVAAPGALLAMALLTACGGADQAARLEEAHRLSAAGRPADAAAILADLSENAPGDAQLLYEHALALHAAGHDDEALD